MRVEYVVSTYEEHRTAEALAEAFGTDYEAALSMMDEHLRAFLAAGVEEALYRLCTDPREQEEFLSFVMSERQKREMKATALAGAAALT